MARSTLTRPAALSCLLLGIGAQAFQLDLEGTLQHQSGNLEADRLSFEKASIGLKEVISDDKGDRLHLFAKFEAEDDFHETNVDQLHVKYKGPMGRWNVTLGRSLVPFGLLTEYDSEMLILSTQEKKTVGYRNDDGVKLSGFYGSIDYELLVSPGKWMKNEHKDDNDRLAVLKTSYKGDDLEDLKIGLSLLSGEFQGTRKKLLGLDIIKYEGLWVSRNELVVGEEGTEDLVSVFAGIDYSVLPSVDLNVAFTHFRTDFEENTAFVGLTYNTPFYGIVLRAGNKHYFNDRQGGDDNEVSVEIYKSYSHHF